MIQVTFMFLNWTLRKMTTIKVEGPENIQNQCECKNHLKIKFKVVGAGEGEMAIMLILN